MPMPFRTLLSVALLATLFCPPRPVLAAEARPILTTEANRYSDWQSPLNQVQEMIDELDGLISEGTRSRAAHPAFLDDLNSVLNRYRIPKRTVLFFDDFSDYEFNQNPIWTVRKGQFQVDQLGYLSSTIASQRPPMAVTKKPEPKAEEESESDRNLKLFLGVLGQLANKGKTAPEPVEPRTMNQAVIISRTVVPNYFNLKYRFRSEATWGSVRIGVFRGNNPESGYHLVYRPSPAGRPLQLITYRDGHAQVIGEAAGVSPDLDDGLDHTIQFSRSQNGEMVIMVDDREVIHRNDLSYLQEFSGLTIINNGGSYGFDNLEIFLKE